MKQSLLYLVSGFWAAAFAWLYLLTYQDPDRNGLTVFLNSFYRRFELARGHGRQMIFFLGVCFSGAAIFCWGLGLWKLVGTFR